MNDPNNEKTSPATDPFVEALIDTVAGHRTSADLTDDERDLIAAIAEWAPGLPGALAELDAERDQSGPAPVRIDDPIAQMLGLVEDPAVLINGRQLAAIRKSVGLTVGDLAQRLNKRGWNVTTNTVFSWERDKLNPPPAIINAVAEILSADADSMLTAITRPAHTLDVLFDDAIIAAFLDEWSRESNVPVERLAEHSKRLLATAGKRNATSATPQTLLAILQHLKNLPNFQDPA
ncbi:helix-turn-helix domain-containing protein [Allobranchiibius sp. CTAmp26]|uniref:helix-turn-helix domain-containing protein n=1 Tax=Allobranchiibius sp. CTAmp26 TaxID=2815214 RepID=UPI001AA1071D|nr:helix-turn-helix transcriptional regulator [Allobranchiibius sp. CTAmp26]MBO1754833.1 helix-turn-helix transcriptional regulator [Allobranchiibius sp. CTAmp26]